MKYLLEPISKIRLKASVIPDLILNLRFDELNLGLRVAARNDKVFLRWLLALFVLFQSGGLQAQSIIGKWKTIDDETNQPKSIVEIFERNGKFYGKITKLFRAPHEEQDPVCDACSQEDERYNKKIVGMEILRDMIRTGDEYTEGTILDPKNGKIYSCKIWLEGNNLKLRGYWGPFYRTQTWLAGQ